MDRRLQLDEILRQLLGTPGKVYYQPPSDDKIVYPCIIYGPARWTTTFADNTPYAVNKRYSVLVIDRNPDSLIPDKVAALPSCVLDRPYTVNNLNHWAFLLYF